MAKEYYCWRCKMVVPMMTEEEWKVVAPSLTERLQNIRDYRAKHGVTLEEATAQVVDGACERYFKLTGFRETNPNALWHHRLSEFGPECKSCGYLLRSEKASYCANCGEEATAKG